MKYMILLYSDPVEAKRMSALNRDEISLKHEILHTEVAASGDPLGGAGLAYPKDSRTIQLQDGIAVRSRGPFVRADRQLTAFYMIDCEGLSKGSPWRSAYWTSTLRQWKCVQSMIRST